MRPRHERSQNLVSTLQSSHVLRCTIARILHSGHSRHDLKTESDPVVRCVRFQGLRRGQNGLSLRLRDNPQIHQGIGQGGGKCEFAAIENLMGAHSRSGPPTGRHGIVDARFTALGDYTTANSVLRLRDRLKDFKR